MKTPKTKLKSTSSKSKLTAGTKSRIDLIKEKRKAGTLLKTKVTSKSKIFKSKWFKKAKKAGLIIAAVFFIALSLGTIRVMAYLQELNDSLPTPDKVFPSLPVASEIYDRKGLGEGGTRLYRLFNEYNSDPVDISQVPDIVKWSFLAAEDSDFYSHGGFDLTALLRCGFAYVRSTGVVCGGSTITQQLVKITALTNEVKLERKIKEILLAVKVEQLNEKDQILEMYLRVAPFGSNLYGVKTAANFYFGKEPKDLTLAEATILGAIIQDPVRLSPTLSLNKDEVYCREDGSSINESDVVKNEDGTFQDNNQNKIYKGIRVKCRQLYILDQMKQKMAHINDQTRKNHDNPEMDDILTEEMIQTAMDEDVKYKPPTFDKKAGHFVDYVLDALTTRNYKNNEEPFTLEELQKGGYKIYTTLDYGIQQIAESYTARAVDENAKFNMNNSAVMTVTPGTGEIIAMSGSKNYYLSNSEGCDENGRNCKFDPKVNIFRTLQSPGSTNKPAGYYMAYKEGKLFTGSLLPDIPLKISDPSGVPYEPKNWEGGFKGLNTAEQMIRDSRNLPAISVIQMIGINNYLENAKSWGYTTYTGQYGPSVILGGADVYPDEHVQAFSVFANNGELVRLNPVLKIVDRDGNTVYEAQPEKKAAADPQGVYLLNQSLKNLNGFSWDGRDLAAKTGTSEDSKDAWFMVWSPDFITLAWGGNNNNDPMDRNNGYPPIVIIPWVKRYMSEIGEAPYFSAKTAFTRPGFVYEGGGDCNEDGCLGLRRGWLIQDRVPQRDIVKKKAVVCTDQQDKLARPIDIAMGLSMEKEFSYYKMPVAEWQSQLDEWLKSSQGTENTAVPTEQCNIDRSGGTSGPFFSFSSVTANTSTINIKGGIFTNSGDSAKITAATFFIDNKTIPNCKVNGNNYESFDISCNVSSLDLENNVTYQFKANASDSKGVNNTSGNRSVVVGSEINSNFNFNIIPTNTSSGSPVTVNVSYTGSGTLVNVKLYYVKGGDAKLIGNMDNTGGNKNFTRVWNTPNENGTYRLYVTADLNGTTGKLKSSNSGEVKLN